MRIRTVKPEIWTSPKFLRLSLRARLLFLALLNYADDEGRGLSDPALIRGALFPLEPEVTDAEVSSWLLEMRAARLLVLYRGLPVGSRTSVELFQIKGFRDHQRVDRPLPSRYAAPRKRRPRSTNRSTRSSRTRSSTEVEVEVEGEKEVKGRARSSTNDGAGSSPNGAGAYDPEAVYVPGPDDPKLFEEELEAEAEESTPPRGPGYWSSIPNPFEGLEAER